MSRLYKSIDERVSLFKSFYRKNNDEHLLGFFLGSEYPLFRYKSSNKLPENKNLTPDDFIVDGYVNDSVDLFEKNEKCGGDFIWSATAFWGVPWVEAALGCNIKANHESGSIYSEPLSSPTIKKFDASNAWVKKIGEFFEKLAERSKNRFPLATTRMRGIADILSAIYGGQEFVFLTMEKPEEVKVKCKEITDYYISFCNYQLKCIPLFKNGIGSFYYGAWAPAGTVWHQEDSVMLLSPELYKKEIFPWDKEIFNAFDNNIMHFHSIGGYIPLDEILSLNPTAVELHIDEGGPTAEELYPIYKKILDVSPLLIWGKLSKSDFDFIFENLPAEGVAINHVVQSYEEAHDIYKEYKG